MTFFLLSNTVKAPIVKSDLSLRGKLGGEEPFFLFYECNINLTQRLFFCWKPEVKHLFNCIILRELANPNLLECILRKGKRAIS